MSNKAPNITSPKGGGAQSGLGEKFSPDLFTGTGNFSVPIALLSGRNGFQPELSLGYSTGNGNSAFGLGWNIGIPGVTRKTSRGIPVYDDETDVFILSGAEDLVMVKQTETKYYIEETIVTHVKSYYRPRTEGLYARIVHHKKTTGENYWEVRSKDGLISLYGNPQDTDDQSCVVANPIIRKSIFSWRLYKTIDCFGNEIVYQYKRDLKTEGVHVYDQLYLTNILYADYPYGDTTRYLLSVSFNYENRPDAFSEYKSGFEIRTTLRCKDIRVFSHPQSANLPDGYNPEEASEDKNSPFFIAEGVFYIKSKTYDLVYVDEKNAIVKPINGMSLLHSVEVTGYRMELEGGLPTEKTEVMPPLLFNYSSFNPLKRDFYPIKGNDLPTSGLGSADIELVDLTGNGLPDILQINNSVRWWRNKGNGEFDRPQFMTEAPGGLLLADPDVQMIDANGNGRADLLVNKPGYSGYFSTQFGGSWDKRSFHKYKHAPTFSFEDPEVKLIDLDGDGVTDVLRNGQQFECFYNHPVKGFYKTGIVNKKELDSFPNVSFSDPRVKMSDMCGDGMQDILFINSGGFSYWPNLGYGRFGKKINMRNSPKLPYNFDPKRILIGDLDGDGLSDLVYVDNNKVTLWINKSGNEWSDPIEINGTPAVTDSDSVRLTDILGSGVSGILWSSIYNSSGFPKMFFLDFTSGNKPYLLQEMNNNMGSITRVQYTPSTNYYLKDEAKPETRWRTELPFPVLVVKLVEVIDQISNGKLATEYVYHHGYWDGTEREFRGFGRVDQRDTETFSYYNNNSLVNLVTPLMQEKYDLVSAQHYNPPTETRTWFHQGAMGDEENGWYEGDYTHEYWSGDKNYFKRSEVAPIADQNAFKLLQGRAKRDALRALRSTILRTELYARDGSELESKPYTVTESISFIRKIYQPEKPIEDTFKYSSGYIFFPYNIAQRTTQWERGNDPMSSFSFSWEYDAYGQAKQQLSVALSRGIDPLTGAQFVPTSGKHIPPVMAAEKYLATCSTTTFIYKGNLLNDEAEDGIYIMNRTAQSKGFDCTYSGAPLSVINFYKSIVNGFNIGEVISHALNYYDGEAFVGLPIGQLGNYGALVRSETLISTNTIYTAAYGGLPQTLQLSPSWLPEYPVAFRTQYPARGGYLYYTSGDHTPGYYLRSAANRYDFQISPFIGSGLIKESRDPFDKRTNIYYDDYKLLPVLVTDPEGNSTAAEYDYRVLQPYKVTDINNNISVFDFSPLGLLRATALIGKGTEGDYKASSGSFYTRYEPSTLLEYDFFSFLNNRNPVWVKTIKREYHYQQGINDETIVSVEYSDGFGRLVQTRTQAEDLIFGNTPVDRVTGSSGLPEDQGVNAETIGVERNSEAPLNVVVSGWQVYNNKGKVVEKYEPFFHYGFDYVPYLLEIFGPENICIETNGFFTTVNTAGSSYHWEVDGATVISGQNTTQITLKWNTAGTKTIKVTETTASGKSHTTTFSTSVYPLPQPTFSSSSSVTCVNVPVTLSANNYYPVYTYQWSLGAGAIIIEQNEDYVIVMWPTSATRSVSVTVGTTVCAFAPITVGDVVEVLIAPTPSLSAITNNVCTGTELLISANNFNPLYTYNWDTDGGHIVSQINDSVLVLWNSPGLKVINLSVNNGGCVVQPSPLPITVLIAPSPSISAPSLLVCDNIPVVISANNFDPSFTYNWFLDADAQIINQTNDTVEVYWTSAGIKNLWVNITNGVCAVNSDTLPIEVRSTPAPIITGNPSPIANTPTPYTVVPSVAGNTYIWMLTPNGNILSGQGTDTIVVEWTTPMSAEQIDLYEDNGACGTNALPFNVVPL